MVKELYEVKNVGIDERRFLDHHKGEWMILSPGEKVITDCPPTNDCFKVEKAEKKEKIKNKIVRMEEK